MLEACHLGCETAGMYDRHGTGTRRVQLRDGTTAYLRPVGPEDADRLRRGLAELSARSRYLRFHAPVHELTDEQVAYLTDVDQHDHIAWLALNPYAPDEPGMGVARAVRLRDDPAVAEAAVTVADRYQGRGLGTLLLEVVAERARAEGIETLRNYVLADNAAMLEVLDHAGARRTLVEPGVWQVDVDLPEGGWAEGSPAAVLRAVSAGRLTAPFETALQWLERRLQGIRGPAADEG
jgi:GNAT superfamily N-acetyltransferase